MRLLQMQLTNFVSTEFLSTAPVSMVMHLAYSMPLTLKAMVLVSFAILDPAWLVPVNVECIRMSLLLQILRG